MVSRSMKSNSKLAIFVHIAAMGLVTVVGVDIILHEAEARGCNGSIAFNASKGRCFHTDIQQGEDEEQSNEETTAEERRK